MSISINPLNKKVLITTDEVIFHGPTDNMPDVRILLQSIIVAETRFIMPILGYSIYTSLVEAKNTLVTSANLSTLQQQFDEQRSPNRQPVVLSEGLYINSSSYLNDMQKALWNEHLHKLTAECVVYAAMPNNRTRFTGQGMMKNSPETIGNSGNSATIGLYELKDLMDRYQWQRINPLIDDMHRYLCTQKYPGYHRDCDCSRDTSSRRSSIITSMYDDETNKSRRRKW